MPTWRGWDESKVRQQRADSQAPSMSGFTAINRPPPQVQPATTHTEDLGTEPRKRPKPDTTSKPSGRGSTQKASGKGRKRVSHTGKEPKAKRRKSSGLTRSLPISKKGIASTSNASRGGQEDGISTDAFEPATEDADCLLNAMSMNTPATSMDKVYCSHAFPLSGAAR